MVLRQTQDQGQGSPNLLLAESGVGAELVELRTIPGCDEEAGDLGPLLLGQLAVEEAFDQ